MAGPAKPRRKRAKRSNRARAEATTTTGRSGTRKKGRAETTPSGRRIPPAPSWNRSLRRSALFALFGVVVLALFPGGSGYPGPAGVIVQFLLFWAFLTPTQYFFDRMAHKSVTKMAERQRAKARDEAASRRAK